MVRLIYSVITSLDGYVADENGNFEWAEPDEEVFAFVDPEAVSQMKARAGRDITVAGPDLAAQAIKAGSVDEVQLFLTPVVVGGGNRALPNSVRLSLELVEEQRFGNGVVYLRYLIGR